MSGPQSTSLGAPATGQWRVGDRAQCVDVRDVIRRCSQGHILDISWGGRELLLHEIYRVLAVSLRPGTGEQLLDVGSPSGPKLAARFRRLPPSGWVDVRPDAAVRQREAENA